ncbi:MAG: 4'-phosphopantetheinyl transferase superfamily protein [Lawsonella clevelandensis]
MWNLDTHTWFPRCACRDDRSSPDIRPRCRTCPATISRCLGVNCEPRRTAAPQPASGASSLDTVLFSAKEALYKAWYPVTGAWLGFEDAELKLIVDSVTSEASKTTTHLSGSGRLAPELKSNCWRSMRTSPHSAVNSQNAAGYGWSTKVSLSQR